MSGGKVSGGKVSGGKMSGGKVSHYRCPHSFAVGRFCEVKISRFQINYFYPFFINLFNLLSSQYHCISLFVFLLFNIVFYGSYAIFMDINLLING